LHRHRHPTSSSSRSNPVAQPSRSTNRPISSTVDRRVVPVPSSTSTANRRASRPLAPPVDEQTELRTSANRQIDEALSCPTPQQPRVRPLTVLSARPSTAKRLASISSAVGSSGISNPTVRPLLDPLHTGSNRQQARHTIGARTFESSAARQAIGDRTPELPTVSPAVCSGANRSVDRSFLPPNAWRLVRTTCQQALTGNPRNLELVPY
jgi:hypothetical protein